MCFLSVLGKKISGPVGLNSFHHADQGVYIDIYTDSISLPS